MATYKIFITEDGEEKDLTREDIVELLYNDVAIVTFTKVDGSERVMKCTLLQEVLGAMNIPEIPSEGFHTDPTTLTDPSEELKKDLKTLDTRDSNVVAVYDIDKEGWRSFRIDSVKSISIPTT